MPNGFGRGGGSVSIFPLAIGFILCMGWIVVDRYSQQVINFRSLNALLAQRVAVRGATLGSNYALLAMQSEERATLREPQRIMRDIHSSVEAHLPTRGGWLDERDRPLDNHHRHRGVTDP